MSSKKKPSRAKATSKKAAPRSGGAKPAAGRKAGKKVVEKTAGKAGTKKASKKAAQPRKKATGPKATTAKARTAKAPARKPREHEEPGERLAAEQGRGTSKDEALLSRAAEVPETAQDEAEVAAPEDELEETTTEELWILYREQVGRRGADAKARLDELRNTLIERHYALVKYIAERLLQTLPKSIELDDLVSAGLFGLMDAIRGFDASRGIKFKTYCSTRVRGAILDQLRSQDWVPRLVRLKASRIERCLQKLTAEYGREPTHTELAQSLKMEHGELVKEIEESRAKTMFSLSEKWEDDDGSVEKVEVLEDKSAIDPVRELNRRDLMTFITRSLTHKERFIIEQYYQYGHTMREIGEMLALTESRVCQIHSNVMSRLKGLLGQRHGTLTG